jgi:hypothetical protein
MDIGDLRQRQSVRMENYGITTEQWRTEGIKWIRAAG